ncbi:MAG TPA: metallophosphoesterase [Candidatus Binatia bacterium]|nr:metallophosphoesterase [Candidatus Binatia bacterium]
MDSVRVAAMGDLHCKKSAAGELRPIFEAVNRAADVLLLCGDLTDYGLPEEAEVLAGDIHAALRVPVLAVLGNHDCESDREQELKDILAHVGVAVLDGESRELHGVGFAGVKGFAGGFGDRMLGPWGEKAIKDFVREAVNEALKLEAALGHLASPHRIAFLHYAPIEQTVSGESPVVFPFLGSSRLEDPLNRYGVAAVFHGHAHHGEPEGRTSANVPVFNVCLPLLRERFPDRPPFRVVEVRAAAAERVPA